MRRPPPAAHPTPQIALALPGGHALAGGGLQQFELDLIVCRTDVLDPAGAPAAGAPDHLRATLSAPISPTIPTNPQVSNPRTRQVTIREPSQVP